MGVEARTLFTNTNCLPVLHFIQTSCVGKFGKFDDRIAGEALWSIKRRGCLRG